MTATLVNTAKVTGRRELQLAAAREIKQLGNWSPGQVFQHLGLVMNKSIDGFQSQMPWIVRVLMGFFMKKKILNNPMGAGFKLPASAARELIQADTSTEQG